MYTTTDADLLLTWRPATASWYRISSPTVWCSAAASASSDAFQKRTISREAVIGNTVVSNEVRATSIHGIALCQESGLVLLVYAHIR